jgi:L-rhamnose mutarotase
MRRVGSVIRLKSEDDVETYETLHAAVWPEVLKQISESNIRNYSIFRYGLLLFSYYEYVGEDFEADMKRMAEDSVTQEWWKICDPLQDPVPEITEGEWWHEIPEIFHTP